jgi:hypothetical protein
VRAHFSLKGPKVRFSRLAEHVSEVSDVVPTLPMIFFDLLAIDFLLQPCHHFSS